MPSLKIQEKRAVVLLSGGLDSATVLAIAVRDGYRCYAISFRYGQRHRIELESASAVASSLSVQDHRIIDIDLASWGGSALTSDSIPVPKSSDSPANEIPLTYVPARNTIFLSFALAWAETLGTGDIFIGVNSVDYSGYPDCRPEYIAAYETMANLATKGAVTGETPVRIHTPLILLSKKDIIRTGIGLGVDYGLTRSCYDPDSAGRACGQCDSCIIRKTGFRDAGVNDPTLYSS